MTKKRNVTAEYSVTEFNNLALYGDGNLSKTLKIPDDALNVDIRYELGTVGYTPGGYNDEACGYRDVVKVKISWEEKIND